MNFLAKISHRTLCQEIVRLLSTTTASCTFSDLQIPNRIERGPTDILKALESTISRDYTAPHYKFHDDPYLTPLSTRQSRMFALSKESGKKAAMWIREEHRDLFQHKVADPEIKAFIPPPIYTEESKVTEETLLYEISNGHVANSMLIYDLLKEDVTVLTKQALLELLCFYNNSEPINDELLETRWYKLNEKRVKKAWIDHPKIDVLFEFLKKQEPMIASAAYSAMICGLAKYSSVEKVWHLYTESQENKLPLSIDGYNAMLSIVSMLKEGNDKQLMMIMDIYKVMIANRIIPNIHTFNEVLNIATTIQTNKIALKLASETLANIAIFKLKPSLTTYYHLLQILNRFGDAGYNNFMKILTSLKEETLTIQDANDLNFFIAAMRMASRQFCCRRAGEMVNELLLIRENYKFIGDNFKESNYYQAYLELILAMEEFEMFFKLYSKLVPHVTVPEPNLMKRILEALQLHPAPVATQYIPKLWSHMLMFGHLDRGGLLDKLLHLMSVHCKPEPDSPLNAQFAEIANTVWDYVQLQNTKKIQHVMMSNIAVGNIMILLLRADNFNKTMEIIALLNESPHLVIGAITTEHINEIFEICLEQVQVPTIFTLLDYMTSNNLEGTAQMAERLYKTVPLSANQEKLLINIVGNDAFVSQILDKN